MTFYIYIKGYPVPGNQGTHGKLNQIQPLSKSLFQESKKNESRKKAKRKKNILKVRKNELSVYNMENIVKPPNLELNLEY